MEVQLLAFVSSEHEPRREMVFCNGEAERAEGSTQGGDAVARDHEVDVAVVTVLDAEEGIDAPPAVEPHFDVRCFTRVQDR